MYNFFVYFVVCLLYVCFGHCNSQASHTEPKGTEEKISPYSVTPKFSHKQYSLL